MSGLPGLPKQRAQPLRNPQQMEVVRHLDDGDAERFPTGQTLVNGAVEPSVSE